MTQQHSDNKKNLQSNDAQNQQTQNNQKIKQKKSQTSSPTITRYVDVAVIGAGTAGQVAFKQILKTDAKAVIINNGYWTTTCATVGCMPSKLLIAAAVRADHAKHSDKFGITGDIHIDGPAVMRRVRQERDRFANIVQRQVDSWDDRDTLIGCAKIIGKSKDGACLVQVNDDCIAADRVIIATGSRPIVPDDWKQALGERLLTSDTIFELPDLPKSLAVIGSGAIGLEMAQAMARLGVTVRLFNRQAKIGGIADPEVNQAAIKAVGEQLDMALGVIDKLSLDDKKLQAIVHYQDSDGQTQQFQADYVLAAIGRKTHLDELGVENIGISLDDKGTPNDLNSETGQIANLPYYIVGDANSHLPLMHVASDEGFNAGTEVYTHIRPQHIHERVTLSIVFSEPNIAQVGQSLPDLQKAQSRGDLNLVIGEVSFEDQGRSRVMGVNHGLLRIYADADTGKLLGACMAAPDGEYIAHILALAINEGLTVSQMLEMPFYHPTILEGLRTALRHVLTQLHVQHVPNEKLTP